jgi:carbonic anhydrase
MRTSIDKILDLARSRREELASPGLDSRPRRRLAILTCMDARLDIFTSLGIKRGDAHVIRNAGGLVTDDAIRSLSISQHVLGTEEIIIIMHEDCGLHGASDEGLADMFAAGGTDPLESFGGFADLEGALSDGIAALRSCPHLLVRQSIRGLILDPRTGCLREIDVPDTTQQSPSKIGDVTL